ncbi:MAG: hypothetical protein ACE5HS_07610 [bacterium]
MSEYENVRKENDSPNNSKLTPASPLADIISLETVVNVLLQKGLCTPEELFEEERKRYHYQSKVKNVSLVQTPQSLEQVDNKKKHGHNSHWLKRKMSKYRWTRRLGTALFGWRWKKVKTNHTNKPLENLHE